MQKTGRLKPRLYRQNPSSEGLKTGRLKLGHFLQSAEADFVRVDAVSTVRPRSCRRGFNRTSSFV